MAPTLILIRHAQALHNVAKDYSLHDPPLSKLGVEQCRILEKSLLNLPLAHEIELIVVSPMRRTLQTMGLALDWKIRQDVPVKVDAGWQENSSKPCDTGSEIDVIRSEFPQYDYSTVDSIYPDKTASPANPYAFTKRAVIARGQACLEYLKFRPEKVIAVVTHSGFLRTSISQAYFANADYRVFDFVQGSGDDGRPFLLKQWTETEEKGGGLGTSLTGVAHISPDDFPPAELMEESREDHGETAAQEVAPEVPRT